MGGTLRLISSDIPQLDVAVYNLAPKFNNINNADMFVSVIPRQFWI